MESIVCVSGTVSICVPQNKITGFVSSLSLLSSCSLRIVGFELMTLVSRVACLLTEPARRLTPGFFVYVVRKIMRLTVKEGNFTTFLKAAQTLPPQSGLGFIILFIFILVWWLWDFCPMGLWHECWCFDICVCCFAVLLWSHTSVLMFSFFSRLSPSYLKVRWWWTWHHWLRTVAVCPWQKIIWPGAR